MISTRHTRNKRARTHALNSFSELRDEQSQPFVLNPANTTTSVVDLLKPHWIESGNSTAIVTS
jgi:hypothetical protein